jgi:hypothetical protein
MTGVEYVVDLQLWPSDRRFRLPGGGSRSLLYRFSEPAILIGAQAVTADGRDLAPGTNHQGVVLAPWAEVPEVYEVAAGSRFSVWYGGDVGEGIVTAVRSTS